MNVESWITPEETPALAEAATALIEARMSRFSADDRATFWASIRKAYNTPYNPPASRKAALALAIPVEDLPKNLPVVDLPVVDLPVVDLPAAAAALGAPLPGIQAA